MQPLVLMKMKKRKMTMIMMMRVIRIVYLICKKLLRKKQVMMLNLVSVITCEDVLGVIV